MARQAVLEILNSSLGRYLSDVDIEKLNMSFWKGQINFPRSVKLNADALNRDFLYRSDSDGQSKEEIVEDWAINVNCDKTGYKYSPKDNNGTDPRRKFSDFDFDYFTRGKTPGSRSFLKNLKIVKGTLHKIQIDVPWAALANRPVVIRVSGVSITVAPVESGKKRSQQSSMRHSHHSRPNNMSSSGTSVMSSRSGATSKHNKYSHDDETAYSPTIFSHLGGGSKQGNGTINSKSSKTQPEGIMNKILRSLPYSAHLNNELLRQRKKKEEDIIIEKRKFVIERRDITRQRNKTLSESIVNPEENSNCLSIYDRRNINKMDDFSQSQASDTSVSSILPQGGSSFYDRLKVRILENLQLDISNVHIQFMRDDDDSQYEGEFQYQIKRFLAGIVLDALSFDTTDEHGRRSFIDRTPSGGEDFLFKALRLSGFGIYLEDRNEICNESGSMLDDNLSIESQTISSMGGSLSPSLLRHDFIVEPLSFEAAYRQSDNSHSYTEYPKYLLFSQLPHLSMCLSRSQLDLMNDVLDVVLPTTSNPLYPEYKPACSITSITVKLWWKYAYNCIRRIKGRRTWIEFMEGFRKRKQYIALYKRHRYNTNCSWLIELSSEEEQKMIELENDRSISIEGIIIWRAMAEKAIDAEKLEHSSRSLMEVTSNSAFQTPKKSNIDHMHPCSSHLPLQSPEYHTYALSLDEIQELEQQLDYASDLSQIPIGSKLIDIEFSFGSLVLDLVLTRNSQPLSKLRLGTVETVFSFSSGKASQFRMSLLSIQLEDTMTIQPIFPSIVKSVHTKSPNNIQSVDMAMNINDCEGDASWPQAFTMSISRTEEGDKTFEMEMVSLEIVASSPFLVEIIDFFQLDGISSDIESSPLEQTLKTSLSWVSNMFFNNFPFGSSARNYDQNQWGVKCIIDGPTLVIPDFYCDDNKSDVFVIDCGKYRFNSIKKPSERLENWFHDRSGKVMSKEIRDCSKLDISDVQCFLGTVNISDWTMDAKPEDKVIVKSLLPLMEPFSVSIETGKCGEEGTTLHTYQEIEIYPIRMSMPLQVVSKVIKLICSWSSLKKDFVKLYAPNVIRNLNGDNSEIYQNISDIICTDNIFALDCTENIESIQQHTFWSLIIHEISVRMEIALESSLEAHFFSIKSIASSAEDDSMKSSLELGRFWLLDNTNSGEISKFLLHSTLPTAVLADTDFSYNNIADSLKRNSEENDENDVGFAKATLFFPPKGSDEATKLNISLSGLHMNWFPSSIKNFKTAYKKISSACFGESFRDKGDVIYYHDGIDENSDSAESVSTAPDMMEGRAPMRFIMSSLFPTLNGMSNLLTYSTSQDALEIKLSMKIIKISLKSIVEDRDIFLFLTKDIQGKLNQHHDKTAEGSISIRSFDIKNPSYGSFHCDYEDLVTMKSFSDEAEKNRYFFCLTYRKEISSNKSSTSLYPSKSFLSAELGPVECIFAFAQKYALQRYFSGNLNEAFISKAYQYVSSFHHAVFQALDDEKEIILSLSDLTVIIPQSITASKHMKVNVYKIILKYNTMQASSKGEGSMNFNGMSIYDNDLQPLTTTPVQASINVNLPDFSAANMEKKSLKVSVNFSKLEVFLTKVFLASILNTINGDDVNLDNLLGPRHEGMLSKHDSPKIVQVDFEKDDVCDEDNFSSVKRTTEVMNMSVGFKFDDFSLHLCEQLDSSESSFVNMRSDNMEFLFRIETNSKLEKLDFLIHHINLIDTRNTNEDINNTYLVKDISEEGTKDTELNISMEWKRTNLQEINTEVTFNALEFTFLPDIIGKVICFFDVASYIDHFASGRLSSWRKSLKDLYKNHEEEKKEIEDFNVPIKLEEKTLETANTIEKVPPKLTSAIKTKSCRILFFDNNTHKQTDYSRNISRSIVLHGNMDVSASICLSSETNDFLSGSLNCHGEDVQLYTFEGHNIEKSMQILDPSSPSFVGYVSRTENNLDVEINIVSLSDLFISLSSQNVVVLSSLVKSLRNDVDVLSKQFHLTFGSNANETSEYNSIPFGNGINFLRKEFYAKKIDDKNEIKLSVIIPKLTIMLTENIYFPDQPLLKVTHESILLGGSTLGNTFNFHVHASNISEYFNSKNIRWERWFLEPWDLNVRWKRNENESIKSIGQYSTVLDIDSSPILLSVTDEFIKKMNISLGAFVHGCILTEDSHIGSNLNEKTVIILPYGIRNHTDFLIHYDNSSEICPKTCASGETKYFNIDCFEFKGIGMKNLYGQDVSSPRTLDLYIDTPEKESPDISIEDMDEINTCRVHDMGDGKIIFSEIIDTEGSLVLYLRSQATIYNCTKMTFNLSAESNGDQTDLAVLEGLSHGIDICKKGSEHSWTTIPTNLIAEKNSNRDPKLLFQLEVAEKVDNLKSMYLGESFENCDTPYVWGELPLPSYDQFKQIGKAENVVMNACSDKSFISSHAVMKVILVNDYPLIEIYIQPRAVIQNNLPLTIIIETPSSNAFSEKNYFGKKEVKSWMHRLEPLQELDVLSYGPSISFSIRFEEDPVVGNKLLWNDDENVEIPLALGEFLKEPALFTYTSKNEPSNRSCIYLSEVSQDNILSSQLQSTPNSLLEKKNGSGIRTRRLSLYSRGCIIDHTNQLLFSVWDSSSEKPKETDSLLSARKENSRKDEYVTILQDSHSSIQISENYHEASDTLRHSLPFQLDELTPSSGGIVSKNIMWDDNTASGYCAFRDNIDSSLNSLLIHIIPEFLLTNNTGYEIEVTGSNLRGKQPCLLSKNDQLILLREEPKKLEIVLRNPLSNWTTDPIPIGQLQLSIINVRDTETKEVVGTLPIDISSGGRIARANIGIGTPQLIGLSMRRASRYDIFHMWHDDFIKVRCQTKEVQIILTELPKVKGPPIQIALLTFEEVDIIYHRIFLFENHYGAIKESEVEAQSGCESFQHSKISLNVNRFSMTDTDPGKPSQEVFTSDPTNSKFMELSIYIRSTENEDIFHIDMIDLNLWNENKKAIKVQVDTSDNFVYRFVGFVFNLVKCKKDSTKFLNEGGYNAMPKFRNADHYSMDDQSSFFNPILKVKMIRVSPLDIKVNIKSSESQLECVTEIHPTILKRFMRKIEVPFEMELQLSEFSAHDIQGYLGHIYDTTKTIYSSKLRYNTQNSMKKEDDTEKIPTSEEDFILSDLAPVIDLIPGLENNSAFQKIKSHVIYEFQSIFNLIDDTNSRAVLKESGSGSIMYASTTQIDKIEIPKEKEKKRPSLSKPSPSTRSLGMSTRNFFANFALAK